MLAPALEGMVGEPLVERRGAGGPADAGGAAAPPALPPGEERRVAHALLDRHRRGQLDEPV
ncbi:MAG: hypothetical protein ACYTDU_19335, partial [Planctomycetota bacterium]